MGCGCGGGSGPAPDGWRLIPEIQLATQSPVSAVPPPPPGQPDRAPAPARSSVPWWVWIVIAVLALGWVRS